MTDLEKRLVALSSLGIWIEHADGHRWIRSAETYNDFSYHDLLESHGIAVNNKIYGGVEEALDVVDRSLELVKAASLLTQFERMGEESVTARSVCAESRIHITKIGKGGLI